MPRLISGLVMQLMRVIIVGGGGLRAEITPESARNTQFPLRTRFRLLAWMQASWRARIWRLSCASYVVTTVLLL